MLVKESEHGETEKCRLKLVWPRVNLNKTILPDHHTNDQNLGRIAFRKGHLDLMIKTRRRDSERDGAGERR